MGTQNLAWENRCSPILWQTRKWLSPFSDYGMARYAFTPRYLDMLFGPQADMMIV